MIKPIILTAEGDLFELGRNDKRVEETELVVKSQPVGRHHFCRGDIYFVAISASHHALVCDTCNLRVTVRLARNGHRYTFHDLRQALGQFN